MRLYPLLLIGLALTGCQTQPPQPPQPASEPRWPVNATWPYETLHPVLSHDQR